jgi:hypothetical protein
MHSLNGNDAHDWESKRSHELICNRAVRNGALIDFEPQNSLDMRSIPVSETVIGSGSPKREKNGRDSIESNRA